MRKIDRPNITVTEVFAACINNVRDNDLKGALTRSIPHIQNAENDFDLKKNTNQLYEIAKDTFVNAVVNVEVLKGIYKNRMLKKDNKGRVYYDAVLMSAPKGRCPLCSQRIATTLDHYLPKGRYALLAVCLLNLIPACKDCNTDKIIHYPTNSEEETLHPYYDDVEGESWLKSKLVSVNPILLEYFVEPPDHWTNLLKRRINKHFYSFNLNGLYTTHGLEEFENIKHQLEKLFNTGGRPLLEEHLSDCYKSRFEVDKNSWQTALYYGFLSSEDFCNGGFI